VQKPLHGGLWTGYPIRARTAKKEILAKPGFFIPSRSITAL
jgi:hypothetical protein